ncbi:MAG: DNA repair protein RecN [Eubacterium sp.]|nr:DNA repair protein RecN [Eubacterium sp.]
MLINLHIVNLALIDEIDIDFSEGLNIMTGETGAGKSIIIGSIGIGLGGRFDNSLLRDTEKDGLVELLFSVDSRVAGLLEEEEIEVEDGEVLISRRLVNGRSVNRINDKTVTVGKLKNVAQYLISLHAQHEQRTLLASSKHLEIVDSYSQDIADLKQKVKAAYSDYMAVSEKLEALCLDETERAKRLDYIRYEINDIESARLNAGEDDELEELYKKASNSREVAELTSEALQLTGYDTDGSAGNKISRATRVIQSLNHVDEGAQDLLNMIADIEGLVSDFNRQLSEYAASMEFDEETLRSAEDRLNLINTLKARYGHSIEDVLATLDRLKEEEDSLSSFEETKQKLEKELELQKSKLEKASAKLSDSRKKAAKALCAEISDAMKELNFNDVRFEMKFEPLGKFSANGTDKAEFYISTNIGEEMKPLVDTASGGELSRVMLAIKSVISETEDTPTLVFDEIDVGISGITAEKVGNMMHRLGESRQVLSITHLPQIAAAADTAYVIQKEVTSGKTITGIRRLDEEGRVMELARLLGGASITDSVISSAREMINRN